MTMFKQIWDRLETNARIGLVLCLVLLAGATLALSLWIFRPDYQVLFSDLAPADAAAMTAELDKMKVPYRLDGGGNTILVLSEDVYKTRLKLVGRDLPLHGTVGFELFNNADIGMTEFAQKVNYQRALQGELTRTILSYEEIQAARVHLALPEQTLFKKSGSQAKASVSLTLKPGKVLQPREVQGIQRLVAASVPEILEQDVTVIDQHGVALTRASGSGDESNEPSASNLDSKEALEKYLNHKVMEILNHTYGAGKAAVSVDVALNRDAVKTTTENVLGADTGNTGVIVHEHQTGGSAPVDLAASPLEGAPHPAANSANREVDYQVGRRVEQVVSAPGAIDKISVAVVVHQQLDDAQIERLSDVISKAIGIDKTRGDGVAVYAMNQFGATPELPLPGSAATAVPETSAAMTAVASPDAHPSKPAMNVVYILAGLIFLLALFAFLILFRNGGSSQQQTLTAQEREELLTRVRQWLDVKPGKHGDAA